MSQEGWLEFRRIHDMFPETKQEAEATARPALYPSANSF